MVAASNTTRPQTFFPVDHSLAKVARARAKVGLTGFIFYWGDRFLRFDRFNKIQIGGGVENVFSELILSEF